MKFSFQYHRPSVILAAVLVFLGAVIGGSMVIASVDGPASVDTPGIKFSHRLHVQESGIACADCHAKAPASVLASENVRPDHTNCESCHAEQIENSCTTCHVGDDPLSYAAKVSPARELMFSHKQHLDQGAECVTCHAGMDVLETATGEHVPPMATCNTCHEGVTASNACEACHTNLASLRPQEHNRTDFLREHKRVAQRMDANCSSCHTQETCQDCHNGEDLYRVNVPGKDLQTPHGPRVFGLSRGQGQSLLKVHDLNFKFTHGLAAKGKSSECQTCHDSQDFCSSCHLSGGNITQGVFRPAGHDAPGFVTLGVGTGGGAHATSAKRDIESCASCHDPAGADPTCITCHVDPDGVRGTNAKTHIRGFMSGEKGEWHEDPGANCYVCHTDMNARPNGTPGQKFCGYCHN